MIDDQSLAERIASDLDGHFELLVRTYQDRLYGFALRLTRSHQEAEECAQDTFVRAYKAMSRYPTERLRELRLRAWLHQITVNVVRNRVRKPHLAAVTMDGAIGDRLASAADDEQPESVAMKIAGWNQMEEALDGLPERYRLAVVLRHVQGLSYAEAADVLGQPVGTTKSDVHRGLGMLREALDAEQTG